VFNVARINWYQLQKEARRDFFSAWAKSGELVRCEEYDLSRVRDTPPGKPHPVCELVEWIRKRLLEMGFNEVLNPVFITEDDILKQWGPPAYAVLDRIYYLATLPRPNVGLSREKIQAIRRMGVEVDEVKAEELRALLHRYKKAEISEDELREKLARCLGVSDELALRILAEVFPELKELKPTPTNLTLRSHMTAAWFLTLREAQYRYPLPVKLFSIGLRFRREQREDPTHLRVHHSASCVVMDEEVSIEIGKWIIEGLLKPLGFKQFKYVQKQTGSDTYYAPGQHYEAYAYYPALEKRLGTGWVEVSDFGIYSPVALANFEIEYPVLNVGVGVERVAMIVRGCDDIRKLVYPQFYTKPTFTLEELARMVRVHRYPLTEEGKALARAIVDFAEKHRDDPSPCEYVVWRGEIRGRRVEVRMWERDPGVKLLGPAAFNEVWVTDEGIIGVIERPEKGVYTGLRYMDGVASLVAYLAEKMSRDSGGQKKELRVRIVRHPSDVNIFIDEAARRYIASKGGKIDFRGPVFAGFTIEIS